MKLLITGGTGFIGTHLVKALCAKHQVYILIPPKLECSIPEGVEVIEFYDTIPELHAYLMEKHIEGIVHLAAMFVAQHQPEQIKDILLSNVFLGTAILEAVQGTDVKWFLNTGTYWQHFNSDSSDYCPSSLYAASKQAFIDMAAFYTQTSDLQFVTLKLSDSFGDGDTRRKLFTVLKEAVVTGEQLQMSPGDQSLEILHIQDIVSGFMHLIEMLNEKKCSRNDYILAAKQRFTLKEVVSVFEKVSGTKFNIVWGGRPYRNREIMCPWNKGIVLPGWEAQLSLEEGIALYLTKNK